MQPARRSARDREISQLVPSHPLSPSTTAASFVTKLHASATLSPDRDSNDTANCSSFEQQRFEVDLSIRDGKFWQFDAVEHIVINLIFAIDPDVAFQLLDKVTSEYTTSITSKSQVHITNHRGSEDDASHRSEAVHKRRTYQDVPSTEGGLP